MVEQVVKVKCSHWLYNDFNIYNELVTRAEKSSGH